MMLSILIPTRNEDILDRTLQDLLENIQGDTEILVVLDGWIPDPPLSHADDRITIIYNPISKGQRAATNQAAKLAKGKYVMKIDGHCAFDKGFDVKMLDAFKITGDNVTMLPALRNLHAYDWVCDNGHRRYQGKVGVCPLCGAKEHQDMVWLAKPHLRFTFTFDKTMHFQYDGSQAKKPESLAQGMLRETMSIQGSCFMLTRVKYFELDICSENFHSWGQQGVEVACKTWLSGGRVISNLNTWYAHMFRTNNFGGFPYPNPESLVDENRELSRELFQRNKWPQAIHSFQWLLDRFKPNPYWDSEPTKGAIFYTPNDLDEKIAKPIREQILKATKEKNIPVVSSSLKKMDFGVKNIRFPSLKKGYLTMFKQILGALENSTSDVIFFLEHDVWYSPSHFDFMPEDKNIFYFNNNVWKVDLNTGKSVKVDKCEQLSGMCVYRETALQWVREKYKEIETNGFDRHFEPQQILRGGWESKQPNIDIRHSGNLTPTRWSPDEFRNKDNAKGWIEVENELPEWGDIKPILNLMR